MTNDSAPKHRSNPVADGIIVLVLIVMLAIVLMPLLWMVVTAMRTKGTAFSLDFFPDSTLVDPSAEQTGFVVLNASGGEGSAFVYLEHRDAAATSLEARVQQGGREPVKAAMQRAAGGLWFGLAPVTAGSPTRSATV